MIYSRVSRHLYLVAIAAAGAVDHRKPDTDLVVLPHSEEHRCCCQLLGNDY